MPFCEILGSVGGFLAGFGAFEIPGLGEILNQIFSILGGLFQC